MEGISKEYLISERDIAKLVGYTDGHWQITHDESYWMLEQAIVGDIVADPTHWQELPDDPK